MGSTTADSAALENPRTKSDLEARGRKSAGNIGVAGGFLKSATAAGGSSRKPDRPPPMGPRAREGALGAGGRDGYTTAFSRDPARMHGRREVGVPRPEEDET